jgi:tRNA dimethylallyltransferase
MPAPLRPIVIVGPTAGGKSELAVALAEGFGVAASNHGSATTGRRPRWAASDTISAAEIINADSMQVYRHMDAGTAKPSPELRGRVPHHLIDIVEPTERFTVADWLGRAETLIAEMPLRQVQPIIVGGTNLYLKALLEGLFDAPEARIDEDFRASLMQLPGSELHRRLAAVDAAAAQRIHPNDRKKLIRALEVFHLTGVPISTWQQQWSEAGSGEKNEGPTAYRHDPVLIGLDWPVDIINRRINARVKEMFYPTAPPQAQEGAPGIPGAGPGAEALPDEVRRLEAAHMLGPQAREALGYKQVLEHLRGQCTLEEAFEKTKILTRRFAKTQRTWLKRYRGVKWLAAAEMTPEVLANTALARLAVRGA